MTVAELLERMSARELAEWMIYDEIDPIGQERADWRAAMQASTAANLLGGKKGKRYKPADFMPKFESRRPKSAGGLMAAFMAATQSDPSSSPGHAALERGEYDGD